MATAVLGPIFRVSLLDHLACYVFDFSSPASDNRPPIAIDVHQVT